jgi:nicotinamide mononucleotide transporter
MHSQAYSSAQFLSEVLRWLFANYIEILATLTGIIYLVYSVESKIQLWFFGLITSSLYIYVFYSSGIYADMAINVYYVIISIYGWYHWKYPGKKTVKELPISKLTLKTALVLLLISLMLFVGIAIVLIEYTNSKVPWWDAFTTAFSITATWMLARKILEHWLIWILVDILSMILYIYKGLYPTVILFLLYTTLAIAGYRQWSNKLKTQTESPLGSY